MPGFSLDPTDAREDGHKYATVLGTKDFSLGTPPQGRGMALASLQRAPGYRGARSEIPVALATTRCDRSPADLPGRPTRVAMPQVSAGHGRYPEGPDSPVD